MEFDSGLTALNTPIKVMIVDLLLSGDNAVLIALACRSLPPALMQRAIFFGTVAAIVLRFVLTAVLSSVLLVPYLKLAGAAALLVIAIQLIMGEDSGGDSDDPAVASDNLWTAIKLIVIADVVMSFDNVVGLAAVAGNSFFYLAMGLLLSVPLLIYGSTVVGRLLERYPQLIVAGGALLAWVAGDLAVSDPVIADWVDNQAFALHLAVPLAAAIFAVRHSKLLLEQRQLEGTGGGGGVGETLRAVKRFLDEQIDVVNAAPATPAAPAAGPVPPVPAALPPKDVLPQLPPQPPQPPRKKDSRLVILLSVVGFPLLFLCVLAIIFWKATGL